MAREGKAPAFQFYAADWLADEDVRTMSLAERGAYIDLLAFCWREGSVPDEPTRCARLIGCTPDEIAEVWPAVHARFVAGAPGRLVSLRMEEQRTELAEFKARAGAGGRAAAAGMSPEERRERAQAAARAKKQASAYEQAQSKQAGAYEQATSKQASACDLLAPANTASATATAVNTPLPPASGGSAGTDLLGQPATKGRKAAKSATVAQHRAAALRVLDALNAARKRVRPTSTGIKATDTSLAGIAGRLAAGYAESDCIAVVAVCEGESRRDAEAFQWFDAVSPWRPENFERKLARSATDAADPDEDPIMAELVRRQREWDEQGA